MEGDKLIYMEGDKEKEIRDKFLLRLVDSSHTSILQWMAVWLASGIGIIPIIIEVLGTPHRLFINTLIYGFIYFVLISLMTISIYNILCVMHLQNKWINLLSSNPNYKEVIDLFYESRSNFWDFILGKRENLSLPEYIIILAHFSLLFIFGIVVWVINFISIFWH